MWPEMGGAGLQAAGGQGLVLGAGPRGGGEALRALACPLWVLSLASWPTQLWSWGSEGLGRADPRMGGWLLVQGHRSYSELVGWSLHACYTPPRKPGVKPPTSPGSPAQVQRSAADRQMDRWVDRYGEHGMGGLGAGSQSRVVLVPEGMS